VLTKSWSEADIGVMDDGTVTSELDLAQLRKEERSISAKRTRLHNRIDFLRAGGGGHPGQDADLLEELERQEREISRQRRELHEQIERASAALASK
jgi:predicted  nucleic acid-binding Zn-ribbon protein